MPLTRAVVFSLMVAAPLAAQDRTIVQSGLEHGLSKAAYSMALYGGLREFRVPKAVAAPIATIGLWGAGYLLERSKGHHQSAVDKVHDLAAHSLIVIPLATKRRPKVALLSVALVAVTIALTCARANPRSC